MKEKKYNYLITHGGRNPNKTFDKMLELDKTIRQKDKFPILYITNEQTAVIISVEEYKRLKSQPTKEEVIKALELEMGDTTTFRYDEKTKDFMGSCIYDKEEIKLSNFNLRDFRPNVLIIIGRFYEVKNNEKRPKE